MSHPHYYEDWVIGHVYETRVREVLESESRLHAEIDGADGAMHRDPEYAKQTVWGKLTVHGLLTLSIASGLMQEMGLFDGTALALLDIGCRYLAPVSVGDQIRVRWWVEELKPTKQPERGIVTRRFDVLNQNDEIVSSGHATALWKRRANESARVAEASAT
jgi:acyl dehydratase